MENPTHSFGETNLVFSSYKNRELDVKLWRVGACQRKKSAFIVTSILSKGIFSKHLLLNKFSEYVNTFTFQQEGQGLEAFAFPIENVYDEHAKSRFKRKLRGWI